MNNNAYKILRDFVREHHGFGITDFKEHPDIYKLYQDTMQNIRQFEGKRVKIQYKCSIDFMGVKGEKVGKIKLELEEHYDPRVRFYEGKKKTRYYYLDAGLFEGWYATLIPLSIEEV